MDGKKRLGQGTADRQPGRHPHGDSSSRHRAEARRPDNPTVFGAALWRPSPRSLNPSLEPVPRIVFSSVSRAASRAYGTMDCGRRPVNASLSFAPRPATGDRRSATVARRPATGGRRTATDDGRIVGRLALIGPRGRREFSPRSTTLITLIWNSPHSYSDEPVQAPYTLRRATFRSSTLVGTTHSLRIHSFRTRNPSRVVPVRSPWVLLKYPTLGAWCLRAARAPGSQRSCARISLRRRLFKPR